MFYDYESATDFGELENSHSLDATQRRLSFETDATTNSAQEDHLSVYLKNFEPIASNVDESVDVIVVGSKLFTFDTPVDWSTGDADNGRWSEGAGAGWSSTGETAAQDSASMDVLVNFNRPLSASEQQSLNNLKATIEALTAAIAALPDNAVLKLPNGADITGAELKAIWARTDFIINDNNFTYRNGGQGEARMAYGDPTVSFNIGYLDTYDNFPGGMNYLVAHELGHLSQAGTGYYEDQRTANDISRAILNNARLPYLENPGFGYTSTAPMQFSVPSGSTGGSGGGSTNEDTPPGVETR